MNEIVLEGEAIDKKVEGLTKVKVDPEYYRTYYVDDKTGEKWVFEHVFTEVHEVPPQLRLISKFPWEKS